MKSKTHILLVPNKSLEFRFSSQDRPMAKIHTFNFKWHLHVDENETGGFIAGKDVGTGGQILHSLKTVLNYLHGLKSLSLVDLQLTHDEADDFLSTVSFFGTESKAHIEEERV